MKENLESIGSVKEKLFQSSFSVTLLLMSNKHQ